MRLPLPLAAAAFANSFIQVCQSGVVPAPTPAWKEACRFGKPADSQSVRGVADGLTPPALLPPLLRKYSVRCGRFIPCVSLDGKCMSNLGPKGVSGTWQRNSLSSRRSCRPMCSGSSTVGALTCAYKASKCSRRLSTAGSIQRLKVGNTGDHGSSSEVDPDRAGDAALEDVPVTTDDDFRGDAKADASDDELVAPGQDNAPDFGSASSASRNMRSSKYQYVARPHVTRNSATVNISISAIACGVSVALQRSHSEVSCVCVKLLKQNTSQKKRLRRFKRRFKNDDESSTIQGHGPVLCVFKNT